VRNAFLIPSYFPSPWERVTVLVLVTLTVNSCTTPVKLHRPSPVDSLRGVLSYHSRGDDAPRIRSVLIVDRYCVGWYFIFVARLALPLPLIDTHELGLLSIFSLPHFDNIAIAVMLVIDVLKR
jgi:hypothetical protein